MFDREVFNEVDQLLETQFSSHPVLMQLSEDADFSRYPLISAVCALVERGREGGMVWEFLYESTLNRILNGCSASVDKQQLEEFIELVSDTCKNTKK